MTYTFNILRDGEAVQENVEVTGSPATIQQLITAKVETYAAAYDTAVNLPEQGEEIVVISS